ncbi:MAG: hypothetical protein AB7S75_16200 [Desulfococcaceae bacterium]
MALREGEKEILRRLRNEQFRKKVEEGNRTKYAPKFSFGDSDKVRTEVKKKSSQNNSSPYLAVIAACAVMATTAIVLFIAYIAYNDYQDRKLAYELLRDSEKFTDKYIKAALKTTDELFKMPVFTPTQPVYKPIPQTATKPSYREISRNKPVTPLITPDCMKAIQNKKYNPKTTRIEYGNGQVLYQWKDEKGEFHSVIMDE